MTQNGAIVPCKIQMPWFTHICLLDVNDEYEFMSFSDDISSEFIKGRGTTSRLL